jgi:hypothetical protein
MASIPDHAKIYKKLHDQREEHVELARRARDANDKLAEIADAASDELVEIIIDLFKSGNVDAK